MFVNRSATQKALRLMTKEELKSALISNRNYRSGDVGWTIEDRIEYVKMINAEIRSRIRRVSDRLLKEI